MFWSGPRRKWFLSTRVSAQVCLERNKSVADEFYHPTTVINQMDTSQAHLSGKTGNGKDVTKPDNLSREELTAVLKYGAQKLYVSPLSAGSWQY